jgi:DNA-binding SARP family transcriptional activator
MTIRICTLGRVRGLIDNRELTELPGQRLRCALLLHLAVEREATRKALCDLLWPDRDEERARRALTQMLHELRRTLGDWVESRSDVLRVGRDLESDAIDFTSAAQEGALERALELYRGSFVGDFYLPECNPFESWVDRKRASLSRLHRTLRRERIKQLLETSGFEAATDVARDWVELEPFEDEAQHRLIELLALAGDRSEALRQFEIYQRELEAQSLEPLPETLELVERIKEGSALGEASELAAARAARAEGITAPPALESYQTILAAAERAANTGHWPGFESIAAAVGAHLLEFVSRIVSADGHVSKPELQILAQVLPPELMQQDESALRTVIAVKLAARSLNDFLHEIPPYLRAIVAHDRAEGTHAAQATCFALLALGLQTAAVDGLASEKEVMLITEYTQDLFRFVADSAIDRSVVLIPEASSAGVETIYLPEQTPGSLEQLLAALHRMVGLERVKREVQTLVNLARFRQLRAASGHAEVVGNVHLIFTGNPGTGQTTVARLLAGIFRELGLVSAGQLVEVDGISFGNRPADIINKAKGGILFVDEAALIIQARHSAGNGIHAISALLAAADEGDVVIVFTGHPENIERLFQSYPKLRSRFSRYVHFDDYDPSQMELIFERLCEDNGYQITAAARTELTRVFENMHSHRKLAFANAWDVRKVFERVVANHADRVIQGQTRGDEVSTIDVPDLMGDRQASDLPPLPTTQI